MGMHHGNSFNREVNERFKSEQYDESELADSIYNDRKMLMFATLTIITPFAILSAIYWYLESSL
jgi:hypothetical protein